MQKIWVQSLGQEDLLEKEMAPHSSTLAWKIPWMQESGGLQSMGSQRVGQHWATSLSFTFTLHCPSVVKNLPAEQETQVPFRQEDPLEKEMATHSSILAWEIPWTEEPAGLQSLGSERVGHSRVTEQPQHNKTLCFPYILRLSFQLLIVRSCPSFCVVKGKFCKCIKFFSKYSVLAIELLSF